MQKVPVIFENEELIALNKPSGLLTIPDRFDANLPSLKKELSASYDSLFIVHRLDRDTSGLILFAKNAEAHKYYSRLFEERKVLKKYLALVIGSMTEQSGTFDQPIAEHPHIKGKMIVWRNGKSAITHYEVTESFRGFNWLTVGIETGRTHQIRVHLQNAGHPVVCDHLYGTDEPILLSSLKKKHFKLSKSDEEEQPILKRLGLHAFQLNFTLMNGGPITLEAPLYKDMQATLRQLQKWAAVRRSD